MVNITLKPTLEIDKIALEPVECTKFLGMWVDENLNWNTHIDRLVNKIKRNMHLLKMPRNLFDEKNTETHLPCTYSESY